MSDPDPFAAFAAAAAAELTAEGFPRMPARVLMELTASDEGRLTSAELSERTGASAAAISGAIRYLTTLGFVRSTTAPGTRKHVYSLPPVAWYTSTLTQNRYAHILEVIEQGLPAMPPTAARERIAEMADFFRFLDQRMPELMEEWRASR